MLALFRKLIKGTIKNLAKIPVLILVGGGQRVYSMERDPKINCSSFKDMRPKYLSELDVVE